MNYWARQPGSALALEVPGVGRHLSPGQRGGLGRGQTVSKAGEATGSRRLGPVSRAAGGHLPGWGHTSQLQVGVAWASRR